MCSHGKPIELHLLSHIIFIVKSITFSSSTVIGKVFAGTTGRGEVSFVEAKRWQPSRSAEVVQLQLGVC